MDTQTPARPFVRSAPLVASGLALLGVGYGAFQYGLTEYLGGFRSGSGRFGFLQNSSLAEAALILGALMCLVGFVALVVGAYRLASNVDAAVQGLGRAPEPSSALDVSPV
ncbi:hypothetical protein DDP54_10000 [Cellulomonas sp. WB94]|uniref:hypothetical protein n=1 Tax=Cellulomonas sp. WB94 TaxID=2173174 RepID=UPI000D56B0A4|nr:hypothetical protein [Cellulomonas sp. WB94]PVU83270.1 hypothetical protein DDP54_10000 [Cellulomonas sp. WB94]